MTENLTKVFSPLQKDKFLLLETYKVKRGFKKGEKVLVPSATESFESLLLFFGTDFFRKLLYTHFVSRQTNLKLTPQQVVNTALGLRRSNPNKESLEKDLKIAIKNGQLTKAQDLLNQIEARKRKRS